jgi:polar amino acid transport system ATP-binding protein
MSRPLPKPLAATAAAAPLGFLHEGRIIELGPPDQVLVDPERPETKRFLRRLLEAGRI